MRSDPDQQGMSRNYYPAGADAETARVPLSGMWMWQLDARHGRTPRHRRHTGQHRPTPADTEPKLRALFAKLQAKHLPLAVARTMGCPVASLPRRPPTAVLDQRKPLTGRIAELLVAHPLCVRTGARLLDSW